MNRTTTTKLSCFAGIGMFNVLSSIVPLDRPTDDLADLVGADMEDVLWGELTLETGPDFEHATRQDRDLRFFLRDGGNEAGYQLLGIDAAKRPRVFLEIDERYGYDPVKRSSERRLAVFDVVSLDDFDPLEAGDYDSLQDELSALFWSKINDLTQDPVVDWEALEASQTTFAQDTNATTLVNLCTLAAKIGIRAHIDRLRMSVSAATEHTRAFVDHLNPHDGLDQIGFDLIDLALEVTRPFGWTWEYNDGPRDRRSGYNLTAETFWIEISGTTAIEKAQAWSAFVCLIDPLLPTDHEARERLFPRRIE